MNGSDFHIRKLVIVGVGLIGGSLALALKRAGSVGQVVGVGRSRANLDKAIEAGAIDAVAGNVRDAAQDADLVVLATPVNTINEYLEELACVAEEGAGITDVGSVKEDIMHAARRALGKNYSRFVPGHPVAGREKSGIDAATGELFRNHKVVLTPESETDASALSRIRAMWETTGASIVLMDRREHDAVLSLTSHLPHILAYVMMDCLAGADNAERCYEMTAGGFYDFTRTASSDPEMWRDISMMNRERLLLDIGRYQARLEEIAAMIRNGEEDRLEKVFADAREARSYVTERRIPAS